MVPRELRNWLRSLFTALLKFGESLGELRNVGVRVGESCGFLHWQVLDFDSERICQLLESIRVWFRLPLK
jgi:hypothetical protein